MFMFFPLSVFIMLDLSFLSMTRTTEGQRRSWCERAVTTSRDADARRAREKVHSRERVRPFRACRTPPPSRLSTRFTVVTTQGEMSQAAPLSRKSAPSPSSSALDGLDDNERPPICLITNRCRFTPFFSVYLTSNRTCTGVRCAWSAVNVLVNVSLCTMCSVLGVAMRSSFIHLYPHSHPATVSPERQTSL